MKKKIKVLVLSDHPFAPSGVGTQTRYMIEHLLETGDFSFACVAGAVAHKDYKPQKTDKWGEDLVIFPVKGYGDKNTVRSLLRAHKPDILWFMTDPRFWGWLWEMEDEIRSLVPMIYYHVWDNYPAPTYNRVFYESTDKVVTISKVTDSVVREVAPDVDVEYLPHAVDPDVFKPYLDEKIGEIRKTNFPNFGEDHFLVFWNNRNARRKQTGSLIYWFKKFIDKVGHDKATLLLHTDPKDPHGQDLHAILNELNLKDKQVLLSTDKLPPEHLGALYNAADLTINISDAEGFGLATLESLSCGTPILVNMTGGLQEQVTDGDSWFGIGIQPSSKAVIGSQQVPFIYEDRLNEDDVVYALEEIYNMSKEERKELGMKGRAHVEKNYNFKDYKLNWEKVMRDFHEKHGSWDDRKDYKRFREHTF